MWLLIGHRLIDWFSEHRFSSIGYPGIKLLSAQTWLSECEYFHKQKWFRLTCTVCTSITSRKLHLKSSRPSNSSKSLTQYCSNTIDASYQPGSIQQTVHYSIITPVPLFIANIVWSIENPFRRSNLQKTENYQGFFCLTMREILILSSIDRWKDFRIWRRRQADGDDHWPVIVMSKNVFLRCQQVVGTRLWSLQTDFEIKVVSSRDETCPHHLLQELVGGTSSLVCANRDLQIGLRVRDWVRVRFSNFKPVTFPELLFFTLVLGRKCSSWDEMGMCRDNVKPEN